MIFIIVVFFYGSMLISSEHNDHIEIRKKVKMDIVLSQIINKQYQPIGHMKIRSCSEIKKEVRRLNGGMLPIPPEAKQPIIDFLAEECDGKRKEAITYLKKYGTAFKIYDPSIEKIIELLSDQYAFDSESELSSDSSCDLEYEPSKLFASLFYNKFSLNNDNK